MNGLPIFYTLLGTLNGKKCSRGAVAMTRESAVNVVLQKFPKFEIDDIKVGLAEYPDYPMLPETK